MIRPVMRDDVISALHQVQDFPGASMSEISGIRRGIHQHIKEHLELLAIDFCIYVRIEIICPATLAPMLVETIRANAHTGKPGDGKIFVFNQEETIRIRTGETGEDAI